MPTMSEHHALQCRAFLGELRRTANVKLSAERVGVPAQTLNARRRKDPSFATEWDAALAYARARLERGGARPPDGEGAKTTGGEYTVTFQRHGRLQVKRAPAGQLTRDGERRLLAALVATGNVRLACDTVGLSDTSVYSRCSTSPEFFDRVQKALEIGHERLEAAMLESALFSLDPDDVTENWIELGMEAPSSLTKMSFEQACILLGMHRDRVKEKRKRRPPNARRATAAETDSAIMDLLGRVKKRATEGGVLDSKPAQAEAGMVGGEEPMPAPSTPAEATAGVRLLGPEPSRR